MEGQPTPPPRPNFTMRPALVVGAIAIVILLAFSIGSAFTHVSNAPSPKLHGSSVVKGTSLRAMSAARGLSVIDQDGQPPANVVDAITLPVGAVRGATTDPGAGSTFDQEVQFSVHASEGAVLGFYKTELKVFGWDTVTSGPASHQAGQQIVGQLAGDDGYYWQLGVIVSPSTFSPSGTTDVTDFTLRIIQVDDST